MADPLKVAVVVDYAHFVAPRGEPIYVSGELAQSLVALLDWAWYPPLAAQEELIRWRAEPPESVASPPGSRGRRRR